MMAVKEFLPTNKATVRISYCWFAYLKRRESGKAHHIVMLVQNGERNSGEPSR